MNMKTKPPQVHKICTAQPEAFDGNVESLEPSQKLESQNTLPLTSQGRMTFGVFGGYVLPVGVLQSPSLMPKVAQGAQHNFHEPMTRIHMGWTLVRMAEIKV